MAKSPPAKERYSSSLSPEPEKDHQSRSEKDRQDRPERDYQSRSRSFSPAPRGERGAARGGERGGVRGGERGGDRGGDRGGERGGDKGGDRGGERGSDRGGDRSGDRNGDGSIRGSDRGDGSIRGSDRVDESTRGSERVSDRGKTKDDAVNVGNDLYVTGLSTRVNEKLLQDHFSQEGKVLECRLILDPRTKESCGFGFVTMKHLDEAERCIKYLNRSTLEGRTITVEKARRQRARTPTPGQYLGARGSQSYRRGGGSGGFGRDNRPRHSAEHQPYSRGRDRSPRYSPYRGQQRDRSQSPQYAPYDR